MPSELARIRPSTARASMSCRYTRSDRSRSARKCVEKFSAASSMNPDSSASTVGDSKPMMLASRVEKPPSASAENAWQTASNQSSPAQCSARMHASVSPM